MINNMKKLMILAAVCLLSAMNSMAQATLSIDDFSINAGDKKYISVNLTNTVDITAIQFDLTLPDGLSIVVKSNGKLDTKLNSSRREDPDDEDHTLTSTKLSSGDYRFVYKSDSNMKILGNSGELFTINVEAASSIAGGELSGTIKDILLVEPNATEHKPGNVTFSVTATTGINEIELSNENPATIYDLKGNVVRKNATSTNGLAAGVYIINSKKVIVK
jgi:hypothetical protein